MCLSRHIAQLGQPGSASTLVCHEAPSTRLSRHHHMNRDAAPLATTSHSSEVTLRDFSLFIWRNRWFALIASGLCALLAGTLAEVLPSQYEADVTLVPAMQQNSASGLGSLASTLSQVSGLASLAGVKLGSDTEFEAEALATLQSRLLTNDYIRQNNLMPILFSDYWNASTRKWSTYDNGNPPTLWDADRLFEKHLRSLKEDSKSGVITFTITWHNAALAAEWANGLVKLTNDYLRQQDINETNRDIAYLKKEIDNTSDVGLKDAIYAIMETEIRDEMIAKGKTEFALHIIDPAVPPQKKSFPQPLLWTIGAAFAGLILGFLVGVVRETLAEESRYSERMLPAETTSSNTPNGNPDSDSARS